MPRLRGAQALVQALEAHGVRYVFGLPGHGNMNILDAIYDSTQVQFKLVRHEQAAANGTLRELIVDREAVYPPVAGVWYEPARSPDAWMPRGSGRQWTV